MADPLARLRRFLRELKRRNVYKVAAAYLAVAFVGIQAARLLVPATTLPAWADQLVIFLAVAGFPVALVLAWAFEVTPEGVRRTSTGEAADPEVGTTPEHPPAEEGRSHSRLPLQALVGLGLAAAAAAGGWYLVGTGGETQPAPRGGERSIAVLPFENMGGEESEQFTRGMHDGLLTRLFNASGLKVTSRTSVMQFEETDLPLPAIADSLGVQWVMEGGVQRLGEQIQVNAQLIDPRSDTHAWAESYRRDLTAVDLFDLQSEITKKIARSLEAELSPEETERVERRPTEDLEAYRLYVQGRSALNTRTPEGMRQAVEFFRRAIRRDSGYALAWSGLADAVGLYPGYGPDSVPADLPDQEVAARRALELDPDLAEAHASVGWVELGDQNGPAALRHLERAVELKPSYVQAHHWMGYAYYCQGRPDAAREHLALAVELNPRHAAAQGMMGLVLLAEGEAAKAESRLQQAPESRGPYIRSLVLYHMQRWDELERLARERLSEGGSVGWRFALARIAVLRGDTTRAREHLAEVDKEQAPLAEGLIHAALGEVDAAFASWRKIEEWSFGEMATLRYWFPDMLDPLRHDPRFRELVGEVNEAWGLNRDGSLPDAGDVSPGAPTDEG